MGAVARNLAKAGKTQRAVESEFSRLALAGNVRRICKGLYWKPKVTRFGPSRSGTLELALEVAGKEGTGPASWSASHALGLTTQVSPTLEMAVVGKIPAWTPEGVRYHARSNKSRQRLGFWEVAWLEVLREWPMTCAVSMEEAGRKLALQSQSGAVDASKLKEVGGGERANTRGRLGELMTASRILG